MINRSVLALVPFFGGESKAAHSKKDGRIRDLKLTVASLPFDTIIGVNNESDLDTAQSIAPVQLLECSPEFIPATLFRRFQPLYGYQYVYATEADQIFHCSDLVWDMVQGANFMVPHRLERLGDHGQGRSRGPVVRRNGIEFVLPNGTPEGRSVYHPGDAGLGFGGGFLATRELFNIVKFQNAPHMWIEHSTGFDIYRTGHCLKSSNYEDCFVEHLSGYEFHNKLTYR